jgi:tetratricopeptide (TPR) repeat protein
VDDQLLAGIAAARDGRRGEARTILMRVVELDERNEQAWLWLAGVMDDPADVRICLENVLELNPGNARARQGLDWLNARYTTATEGRGPRTEDDSQPAKAPVVTAAQVTTRDGAAQSQSARLPAQPSAQAENPCPYCGAPTTERQRSCTQCRRSLLVQLPPAEKPSRWLGWLAGTWNASAVTLVLGALAYVATALLAYQAARFGGPQERPDAAIPLGPITVGTVLLVLAGVTLSIARGLRRRQLAAYYATVIAVPLALVLATFALLRGLPGATLVDAAVPAESATLLAVGLTALLVTLLVLLITAALLGGMAYRDFFGPMERFRAVVTAADPITNYNNGVAYKDRGMWYMATREWERAVARAPRDINYLRALGLAYAQLGRFEPARATIERALQVAPGHAQLLEDKALVERLAAKAD